MGRSLRTTLAHHTAPVTLGQMRTPRTDQHEIKACTPRESRVSGKRPERINSPALSSES